MAVPQVSMEPKTTVHCVDHSIATMGKFLEPLSAVTVSHRNWVCVRSLADEKSLGSSWRQRWHTTHEHAALNRIRERMGNDC